MNNINEWDYKRERRKGFGLLWFFHYILLSDARRMPSVESADHQIRRKIRTAPMEGITMDIDDEDKRVLISKSTFLDTNFLPRLYIWTFYEIVWSVTIRIGHDINIDCNGSRNEPTDNGRTLFHTKILRTDNKIEVRHAEQCQWMAERYEDYYYY